MAGAFRITLDDAQLRAAMARLAPARLAARSRLAMAQSVRLVQALVRAATPVDTGALQRSIVAEVRGTALTGLVGRVASPLAYAPVVEWGRRAGAAPPPVAAIQAWAARRLSDGSRATAFVIARAIGARGLAGRHMFRDAAARGEGAVRRLWLRVLGGG